MCHRLIQPFEITKRILKITLREYGESIHGGAHLASVSYLRTIDPPNVKHPSVVRSLIGTQAAKRTVNDVYITPSPIPISTLNVSNPTMPPEINECINYTIEYTASTFYRITVR